MKKDLFGYKRAITFQYDTEDFKMAINFLDKNTHHLGVLMVHGTSIDDIIATENMITEIKKEYKDNPNHLEFYKTLYKKLTELFVVKHIQLKSFTQSKNGLKNLAVELMKQQEFKDLSKNAVQKASNESKVKDTYYSEEKTVESITLFIKNNRVKAVDNQNTVVAEFNYRKNWSFKKYIKLIFENTLIKPSWDFRYKWEVLN